MEFFWGKWRLGKIFKQFFFKFITLNVQSFSHGRILMLHYTTWYMSRAKRGYFSLGTMTTELDLAMAAPNKDTKLRSGEASGQAIPITPTGSWILITVPKMETFIQVLNVMEDVKEG